MILFEDTGIQNLSAEYVQDCQASEFTEDPNFLLDFSKSSNESINKLISFIKKNQGQENIWNVVSSEGISSKGIQVWIFYLLHHGTGAAANFEEKERALYAAHIYILLLSQPGSSGIQFHHSLLYEKALNSFKIACAIGSQSRSKKSKTTQQSIEENIVLNLNEEVSILDDFARLLKDFCSLLQIYPLKNRPNELKQSVEAFVLVVKSFASSSIPIPESYASAFLPPSQQSFNGLRSLVNAKHGNVEELSTLVFRLLMTTITMRHAMSSGATTLPRWATKQAEAATNLILSVYNDHGQSVSRPIWKICQNLIAQCPDRVENRSYVSNFVEQIISKMPVAWYASFAGWILKFVNHSSKGYRSGALSLISNIITKPERTSTDEDQLTDEQKANLSHKQLLQIVIAAVSDIYPTIRAKALLVLASAMETVSPALFVEVFQGESNLASPNRENRITSMDGVSPMLINEDVPLCTPAVLNSVPVPSLCNVQLVESNLFSLLSDRAGESKYMVRKNAVSALETAVCLGFIPATKETLEVLEERCRDPMLSIRKSAIQSLTNVLNKYPNNVNVQHAWMTCLLPSVMDPESSMQEKAVQLIETKILSGLNLEKKEVWHLLLFLTIGSLRKNRVYLKKVTREWHNQGKLKSNILNGIFKLMTDTKKKAQCWMLLCIVTLFTGDKSAALKVVRQWKVESEVNPSISLQMDMVSTLGHVAKHMTAEDKSFVLETLKRSVENGKCQIQVIGFHFEAIYQIFESDHPDRAAAMKAMKTWCSKLLSASENALSNVVITQTQDQRHFNEDELINHLYVVGEAAQRCDNVSKRLKLSIQALLTNTSPTGTDLPSQPLSQFGAAGIPPALRAHAVFNLGRMCFRDEALAKKCTPAIARELEGDHEECRNNALVILTDLCVLQTQLADPFLQEMANCLGDSSSTIRKQAVILISSLLQREYVKWKDALLFKFLFAACDDCDEVRSLARHLLLDQLLRGIQASGSLFYRNFVACLFYFNSYDGHNIHKYTKTMREKNYFDLSENFTKRMEIYECMLMNMEDQHRINLTGKLCTDILESFVENTIPLNNQTRNLLTDTLDVLCCKEIRLRCIRSREENEIEDEMGTDNPDEQLKIMQNVAKRKLILQTVKLNLVENIIPIIIALKNMLAELKSPLVKNVMLYLKEVMKEYRKEVDVILSADKQLASEIEFDLKRFEREQENAQLVVQTPALPVPNAQLLDKDLPTGKKSTPTTPDALSSSRRSFLTPATAQRKKRPINVEAILRSAQKIVAESPRPKTPLQNRASEEPDEPKQAATPRTAQAPTRAASTPQTSTDPNVTFAARDISMIAGPGGRETMLMLTLRKSAPRKTWNISPRNPIRRSSRKTTRANGSGQQ